MAIFYSYVSLPEGRIPFQIGSHHPEELMKNAAWGTLVRRAWNSHVHDFSSIQHSWNGLRLLRIQTSYIQICWDTQTFRGDPPRFYHVKRSELRNSQKAQNARAGPAPKLGRGAKSASRGARRRGAWTAGRKMGFVLEKGTWPSLGRVSGVGIRAQNGWTCWMPSFQLIISSYAKDGDAMEWRWMEDVGELTNAQQSWIETREFTRNVLRMLP